MPRTKTPRVVRVDENVILEFPNGTRIRIAFERAGTDQKATGSSVRGRKPSPATKRLIEVLHQDKSAGLQRSREEYVSLLKDAGHKGSHSSGNQIVNREARRAFGKALPRRRSVRSQAAKASRGRRPGRPAAVHTVLLRDRLANDAKSASVRDASYYVKWLVDQPGVSIGLKAARPIVYRELRATQR